MCGICGFYGMKDRPLLEAMAGVLVHRGPDDSGFYEDERVSLGHRRLSIIDLSPQGRQPMANEDNTIWLAFNGEIYNFRDLRAELENKGHIFRSHTDSEVILHSYEENGLSCVDNFRGMFAFALWDSNKRRLIICRDRIGKKPLYYWQNGERLIFASELKSLLCCREIPREVNMEGFYSFLAFQYVPGVETAVKNIFRVPPGNMLIAENGTVKLREYWSIRKIVNSTGDISADKAMDRMGHLLEESANLRLVSDVPLGVLLSGGLDSSSIVALISGSGVKSIRTFSAGFGEESDEFKYARIVSGEFNTEHREFIVKPANLALTLKKIVWHMDEPIADGGAFATYMIAEVVKQYVKVILVGEGADELFAGYSWHRLSSPGFALIPGAIKNRLYFYLNTFYRRKKNQPDIYKEFKERFNLKGGRRDFLSRMMFFELENLLPNCLLMKVDKMTMAHSLEARAPFLDHKLIEFAAALPAGFKMRGLTNKYILRKFMENKLPSEIVNRKKRGFLVPITKWLNGELKKYAEDILLREDSFSACALGLEKIRTLFIPRSGLRELENKILLWRLLVFELWFDLNILK
ncbi:MAG: asparagine synthase (glutamine-hydrolyzing) [Candidatus Omnitrophota bacterium]|nr:asparagine synthase (glutamine-hydrolyzing) [Candidatus Omnitrophota bacterium]